MEKFVLEWCYGEYSDFCNYTTTVLAESKEYIEDIFKKTIALRIEKYEKYKKENNDYWMRRHAFEKQLGVINQSGNISRNISEDKKKLLSQWRNKNPMPEYNLRVDVVINKKTIKNYENDECPKITELNEWFEEHVNEDM